MRLRLILVGFVSASPLMGQQVTTGASPEMVVKRLFDALAARDFDAGAVLLDTNPLLQQRRQTMRALRRPRPPITRPSPDEYMKHDPTMPRVVAEYMASRVLSSELQEQAIISHSFADVDDTLEFQSLTGRQLAARWLKARDQVYSIERLSRSGMCGDSVAVPRESLAAALPKVEKSVVGAVTRSDTAYVLYQEHHLVRGRRRAYEGPKVLTLTRGSAWLITPDDMFNHYALALSCGSG